MNELFVNLNDEQKEVVRCIDGPVIVFAGAGSGKTRVITYRIAYLLSLGVSPYNILAMTFTNKAAEEMKNRVDKLVPGKGKDVWVSTFHSFCANFLYKEAEKAGIGRNFVIYDETDQKQVIKECMKEMLISEKELSVDVVKEMICRAKDNLLDSESYKINSFVYKDSFRDVVSDIYIRYENKLQKANALDFGDLLLKTVETLRKDEELKEKYSGRFRYIHIDEYQDVNLAQAVLAKILASKHNNICVVGDDDQAIYSWRGADVNYLLNFKKEFPSAKEFKLERNYRSTKIILEVANALISHNSHRASKHLWSSDDNCSADDIKIINFNTEYDEARFIAREIKVLKEKYNEGSIAVFYRTNAQSRVFEEVFLSESIPYRIIGSVGFYERQEIKDIISYLRVMFNTADSVSLKRIINVPVRGIGDTTVTYLETLAKEKNTTLWEQIVKVDETDLSLRTKNAVWKFLSLYDVLKSNSEKMLPSEFIPFLVEKIGYIKMLEEQFSRSHNDQRFLDKVANIEELVSAARNYEIEEGVTTIEDFLTKISLLTKVETEGKPTAEEFFGEEEYVSLMTLHAAKGLEFDTVFITGLEERIFPVWWAVNGHILDIEEERRLCYVGITRAKKKLYLTYSKTRRLWGSETHLYTSRFINEITDFFSKVVQQNNNGRKKDYVEKSFLNSLEEEDVIEVESLKAGEYVQHEKFGVGRVIDIFREPSGDKAVILFSDGEKRKLHLGYTVLKKLSGDKI